MAAPSLSSSSHLRRRHHRRRVPRPHRSRSRPSTCIVLAPVSSSRDVVVDAAASEAAAAVDAAVPVTIVTGFLGSGKTTLMNNILTQHHGKRIAVIINEFGEMDVDGDLVASATNVAEDVMMLNNGCLCCTVRGDLVRMLGELVSKKEGEVNGRGAEGAAKFDHILIETTGLADPRPIVQTFFNDMTLVDKVHLDGVVCVVDSFFAEKHLDEKGGSHDNGDVNEAKEQICYSDRIIINKVDLVEKDAAKLEGLEARIRLLNPMAEQKRTSHADVDVEWALGVGGFNLETVSSQLESQLKVEESHEHGHGHHHHDHDDHEHHHHHEHDHHHDGDVGSVSLVLPGNLDLEKVNLWLETLLVMRQNDIYRTKGVLAIEDWDHRFVFQGVHEMFSGAAEREWDTDEERVSRLVFIGKHLNQEDMMSSFKACLATEPSSKGEGREES